jgi:hypothetical protein
MPITGNFSLQMVFDEFGSYEKNNVSSLNIKGLSQAHLYIFTPAIWNITWNPRTLKDFTGLGRPEVSNFSTTAGSSWRKINVSFNVVNLNNFASTVNNNNGVTVSSLNTKVAVDYYQGSSDINPFPTNPNNFSSTGIWQEQYTSTGTKTLVIDDENLLPGTAYQVRLRYFNRFNEQSSPLSTGLGSQWTRFEQGTLPPLPKESITVTTLQYPRWPVGKANTAYWRYSGSIVNLQLVWLYENVTPDGDFTTSTTGEVYQPSTYLFQYNKTNNSTYIQLDGTPPVTVNVGTATSPSSVFNKGAKWGIQSGDFDLLNIVQIKASAGGFYRESLNWDATQYPYPNPITDAANLLSTTSVQFNMNLQNVSSVHPARYYWSWRYTSPTVSDYFGTSEILTTSSGTKQLTLTVNTNSTIEFRARAYRETDIFVTTFGDSIQFLGGEFLTISTDIRPKNVQISGIFQSFGVFWSHPPAYPSGLPSTNPTSTYTVQIYKSDNTFLFQITGVSGTATQLSINNICDYVIDGTNIKARVLSSITGIGTGTSAFSTTEEVFGCGTEGGGGNGTIGQGP